MQDEPQKNFLKLFFWKLKNTLRFSNGVFLCRRATGGSYLQNKCLCECEPPVTPRHILIITHRTISYNNPTLFSNEKPRKAGLFADIHLC
ncbi:MAG: hypothetical protein A2644_04445 [Candidatus Zambryskibacteria bacterium RIFCSPHIGHO2_01_FULL_39_63]|nr:MAG: hypothetical protein A2644_04445 [Candidatus Zambryskibacteria bacterium RIFCSPHIGHO2_01_FULL_39_63]